MRNNIAATETVAEGTISEEAQDMINEQQTNLVHKLQNSLSNLQVQVFDISQELVSPLNVDVLQRVAKCAAQLQADLVAVTGVQAAVQVPAELITHATKYVDEVENLAKVVDTTDDIVIVEHNQPIIIEQENTANNVGVTKQKMATAIDISQGMVAGAIYEEVIKQEFESAEEVVFKVEDISATNASLVTATVTEVSKLSAPGVIEKEIPTAEETGDVSEAQEFAVQDVATIKKVDVVTLNPEKITGKKHGL